MQLNTLYIIVTWPFQQSKKYVVIDENESNWILLNSRKMSELSKSWFSAKFNFFLFRLFAKIHNIFYLIKCFIFISSNQPVLSPADYFILYNCLFTHATGNIFEIDCPTFFSLGFFICYPFVRFVIKLNRSIFFYIYIIYLRFDNTETIINESNLL